MNLPNGFGSVYKLSGNRRNPWCARKTIGWTFNEEKQKSYPEYKFIGYYPSRKEALIALTEFNKDPYDLSSHSLTFSQVYDLWSAEHFQDISDGNVKGIKSVYKMTESIQKMKMTEIKLCHLQNIIDESGKNYPTLKKLKIVISQVFDYAVRHEIVTPDRRTIVGYMDISHAGNPDAIERIPFSKTEIQTMWDCVQYYDKYTIPLILIYTGLRISELMNLKKTDVHLDESWFQVTKSKTTSGIRSVPIADKIKPLLRWWMNHESEWVVSNQSGGKMLDKNFRDYWWIPSLKSLGTSHTPHDTRHTCVSLLTEAGIDERIIQQIVGHKGHGVTQSVYTHIDIAEKIKAINTI